MNDSDHQRFLDFYSGGRKKEQGCLGQIKNIGEEYICPAFTEKPFHKSRCGPQASSLGKLVHCSLSRAGGKGQAQVGGGQMYTTTGRLKEKSCSCQGQGQGQGQNGGSTRDAGEGTGVGYYLDIGGPHLANRPQFRKYGEQHGTSTVDTHDYSCKTPIWSPKCV